MALALNLTRACIFIFQVNGEIKLKDSGGKMIVEKTTMTYFLNGLSVGRFEGFVPMGRITTVRHNVAHVFNMCNMCVCALMCVCVGGGLWLSVPSFVAPWCAEVDCGANLSTRVLLYCV